MSVMIQSTSRLYLPYVLGHLKHWAPINLSADAVKGKVQKVKVLTVTAHLFIFTNAYLNCNILA